MKCNPWVGGSIGRRGFPMLGTGKRGLSTYIKDIFSKGEQGFAYDPNDLSTMFQDAAGTVPVTGVGQPLGLVLDKSKGLVLGNEAIVGGNFENGLIASLVNNTESSGTITLNAVSPISGTQDAKVTVTAVSGLNPQLRFNRSVPRIAGALYELSFDYRVLSGSPLIAQIYNGSGTSTVNKTLSGSGKFTARYMAAGAGVSFDQIYFSTNTFDMQIDNVSVKQILGNHAYQTTSASRPILRQNAITGAYYLEFDGSDDFLLTNSIDFTAVDKVSLFTGVRKFNDVVTTPVFELGTVPNTSGYFGILAPALSGVTSYSFASNRGGSLIQTEGGRFAPAPDIGVISALSLNRLTLRRNGVLVNNATTNTGTGNYGNYPLYIGRRGGTALPFNGHLYGLIGIGRLTTDNETAAIEKELAKRTGVTLS